MRAPGCGTGVQQAHTCALSEGCENPGLALLMVRWSGELWARGFCCAPSTASPGLRLPVLGLCCLGLLLASSNLAGSLALVTLCLCPCPCLICLPPCLPCKGVLLILPPLLLRGPLLLVWPPLPVTEEVALVLAPASSSKSRVLRRHDKGRGGGVLLLRLLLGVVGIVAVVLSMPSYLTKLPGSRLRPYDCRRASSRLGACPQGHHKGCTRAPLT